MFETPIIFIVYNRPKQTSLSFECIRSAKPKTLYLIADGPNSQKPTDTKNCQLVREIISKINWKCQVYQNFADENLGLKNRVVSGLDWAFQKTDSAIILEDDCVPHNDFFFFAEAMLNRYRHSDDVATINGANFQNGIQRGDGTYYFSKYNHCWGWATWSHVWQSNSTNMEFWEKWRKTDDWESCFQNPIERNYWQKVFDDLYQNDRNTWAIPFTGSLWYKNLKSVTPNANLVSNVGFGPDGVHTKSRFNHLSKIPSYSISKIRHPSVVTLDRDADAYTFDIVFHAGDANKFRKVFLFLRSLTKRAYLFVLSKRK